MMHLIQLPVSLLATHIPEKRNVVADALSRNNMSLFHLQFPEADSQLSAALVSQNITWTSMSWIKLFKDCTLKWVIAKSVQMPAVLLGRF